MAAVDMAKEEAATQLFSEKNQANTGSLTLQPVGRPCTEWCLLLSEGKVGHHFSERVQCDPAPHLVLLTTDDGTVHLRLETKF
ncbi:hypothetical protein PBY51_022619 [Eleginops maclovinus]|uniref:Uncharacterized protein n=1 Tax=Eleginops maclovinus TaxID=56733 RepID=A0AAN7XK64_ELEMC|nr:hypothetical protein PBY51_022619 [Eleginops maclovinus]